MRLGDTLGVVGGQMGGMTGQNVENSKLVMIFDETRVILGLFQYVGTQVMILNIYQFSKVVS